jgi:transcriptional regulator with XRE-family HTH domain
MMTESLRKQRLRKQLGAFVRSHRERLAPDIVVRRRRTPGLRREELAARAGIGATWCAWIEQGRDISISAATLARLAVALALTPAERAYLFELAERRDPDAPRSASLSRAPDSVTALVKAIPYPAYGLDRSWNACCWNDAAEHLFAGWLGEGCQKNLLHYTYLDPTARDLLPDWEDRAGRLLAEFRADYGRMVDDLALNDLIAELKRKSDLFSLAWDNQAVMSREGGARTFLHPTDGLLSYCQHTFSPADRTDYKFVALIPEATD